MAQLKGKLGDKWVTVATEFPTPIGANITIGTDTTDANATASDIAKDKTAYVNGEKITGNLNELKSGSTVNGTVKVFGASPDNSQLIIDTALSTDELVRAGGCFRSITKLTEFGDAAASDVANGKTFTSASGLKVTGTHVCEAGVELPELDSPGTASDLAQGKQLIDADGNIINGQLFALTTTGWLCDSNGFIHTSSDTDVTIRTVADVERIIRKNAAILTKLSLSEFGDATAADVVAGKTFTSAAGFLVTGTATNSGGTGQAVVFSTETTPSENTLSLTFSGLSGEPTLFSVEPTENVTLSTTRQISNVSYNGNDVVGAYVYRQSSYGTATSTYSDTDYSYTYDGGTLTVTSASATSGGYFANGITYRLTYITDTLATGGIDTSDATATAAQILSGATAYVKGTKITGTIQSRAAQTITPTTQQQTIPAGVYLSGTQTISAIQTQTKTVTENGTVTPDAGKYLSSVVVNVPASGITPSGTLNITENGTYDVTNYASATVNVAASGGGSTIKTGTTTSQTIDTGLSSIEQFFMYKEAVSSTGLIHLHYSKTDGTSYLHASAWSTSTWGSKTITNGTTNATVSGGSITIPGTSATNGGLSSNVTYTWVAVGAE